MDLGARDRVPGPGRLGAWVPGPLDPTVIGSLGYWVPGSLGPWAPGSLGPWAPGSLGPCVAGPLRPEPRSSEGGPVTQEPAGRCPWAWEPKLGPTGPRFLGSRIRGSLCSWAPWAPGPLGPWVPGSLGSWVAGFRSLGSWGLGTGPSPSAANCRY